MQTLHKIIFILFCLFSVPAITQTTFHDHDNDGVEDSIDLDDDNDGILDEEELRWNNPDIDGDGILNHLDLDSDNDGITDVVESGQADLNGDGIVDHFQDNNADGWIDMTSTLSVNLDIDADGLPNYLDTDSDNDGITDAIAAGGLDANSDGRLDGYRDVDYDGLSDVVDGDIGNMLAPGDVSLTPSSKNMLMNHQYFNKLKRLARSCEDLDVDGLCDCNDGDLGNKLRAGHDFMAEEL